MKLPDKSHDHVFSSNIRKKGRAIVLAQASASRISKVLFVSWYLHNYIKEQVETLHIYLRA
jgi:hypothetical protein